MTQAPEKDPTAQALGIIAAAIERRCADLAPHRIAKLADAPQQELAQLMRKYRLEPLNDALERRLEAAFDELDGPALPKRIDAGQFWLAYYQERKRLKEGPAQ